MIENNNKIPTFTAINEDEEIITQDFFLNKAFILFFYPRDDTPGCTIETKEFSFHNTQFLSLGIELYGVSKDDQNSHKKFKNKYNLNVNLLYDHEGLMCDNFKVWKTKQMYGKKFQGIERSTFLINRDGEIVEAWRKVKVDGHVQEVLSKVKEISI